MRTRFSTLIPVLVPVVFLWLGSVASAQGDKEKFKARYEALPSDSNFDRHDLSGIWTQTKLDHSLGTPAPPLTPAGIAAMAGRMSTAALLATPAGGSSTTDRLAQIETLNAIATEIRIRMRG